MKKPVKKQMKGLSLIIILIFSFSVGLSTLSLNAWAQDDWAQDDFETGETDFETDSDVDSLFEESDSSIEDDFDLSGDELDAEIRELKDPPVQKNNTQSGSRSNSKIKKSKNGKYIYHPNQDKGLYRIDRNGNYYYKIDGSKSKSYFSLKGGNRNFSNYVDDSTDLAFSDIYDSDSAVTIMGDWEFRLFKKLRTLTLKIGSGITYAKGTGRFADSGGVAQSSFTFLHFPNNVGLTYRLRFTPKQLFVPYATGGLDYHVALEIKQEFSKFSFAGVAGAHAAGGLAINLGWLDKLADLELDSSYGVNNLYLTIEVRQFISFYKDRDLSGTNILAGFNLEF